MRPFRTILLVILLLVPPGATAVVTKLQRYPRRFAEIVPGQLFRGGFPTAQQIRNLKADKNIRTIVSLTGYRDEPQHNDELRVAEELGIAFDRIGMPGDGCADFAALDKAAHAIGNKKNWPVFFHCAAGKQRSNAVLAVYWLKKRGWPLNQVLDELEDRYDLDRETEKELVAHLTEYNRRLNATRTEVRPIGR